MADTERQFKWALICGIDVALMGTEMWHWQVALLGHT
ncbi:unnamed protein product, partial [Staurois parvus]